MLSDYRPDAAGKEGKRSPLMVLCTAEQAVYAHIEDVPRKYGWIILVQYASEIVLAIHKNLIVALDQLHSSCIGPELILSTAIVVVVQILYSSPLAILRACHWSA